MILTVFLSVRSQNRREIDRCRPNTGLQHEPSQVSHSTGNALTMLRTFFELARATRNYTEARALGLENIPRGSPYYAPWLDRDDDGLRASRGMAVGDIGSSTLAVSIVSCASRACRCTDSKRCRLIARGAKRLERRSNVPASPLRCQ